MEVVRPDQTPWADWALGRTEKKKGISWSKKSQESRGTTSFPAVFKQHYSKDTIWKF